MKVLYDRVTQVNNIFLKWLSKIEFFILIVMMYIYLLSYEYPITKACLTLDPFFGLFWPCGPRDQFLWLMKNDKKLFYGEILI